MSDKEDDAINDPEVQEALDEFLLNTAEAMLIIDRGVQAAIAGTSLDNDRFRQLLEFMRAVGRVEGASKLVGVAIPRSDDDTQALIMEAFYKLGEAVKAAQG